MSDNRRAAKELGLIPEPRQVEFDARAEAKKLLIPGVIHNWKSDEDRLTTALENAYAAGRAASGDASFRSSGGKEET